MAVSNVNSYTSAYESLCASKQTTTGETGSTSATGSAYQTTDEYLGYLRQ